MEDNIGKTSARLDYVISQNAGAGKRYKGSDYIQSELDDLNPPDEEEGQDIFDTYGFGIMSWFALLRSLIKIYFVFACVGAGIMYFY